MIRWAATVWILALCEDIRKRTIWTKDWFLRWDNVGAYDTLISESRQEDTCSFLNFVCHRDIGQPSGEGPSGERWSTYSEEGHKHASIHIT